MKQKTQLIKFKEKADRNILIINNFILTQEHIFEKEKYIKDFINEYDEYFSSKIKKIDQFGTGFHVVFEHEDISMEMEKCLNYLLGMGEEGVKKNLEKIKKK